MRPNEITTILITGGDATRLRPLSFYYGKPMISFMGKPLLLHIIKNLSESGFTNLIFTSGGKNNEIKDYFGDGKKFLSNIDYSPPPKWLGTAGTIANIIRSSTQKISDPFMVIYGDSLIKTNYLDIITEHIQKKSDLTILSHKPDFSEFRFEYHDSAFLNSGPRTNYGIMNVEQSGVINLFEEKPLLNKIPQKFINPVANATVYILSHKISDSIPLDSYSDFPTDIFPLIIKQNFHCYATDIGEKGYRIDLGTIANLYNAHIAILKGDLAFDHYFPKCSENIWKANNSIIDDVNNIFQLVLGENSKISENCCIGTSVIGNNTVIGKGCNIMDSIIMDNVKIGNSVHIHKSIIGAGSVINNDITIPLYTVVGNFCHFNQENILGSYSSFQRLI